MIPPAAIPMRDALFLLLTLVLLTALIAPSAQAERRPQSRPTSQPTNEGIHWRPEFDGPAKLTQAPGGFELDAPAGATVWYPKLLSGPLTIQYTAAVIQSGGKNDRLSDLNCFWMARDARSPEDLFATVRSGKFADYDQLKCYYVGYGGNGNTTTRFRRYIGEKSNRPLLPEHDLRDARDLLVPNHPYHIKLVADGQRVQFWRDGELVFNFADEHPYTSGWFALRTVNSHIRISEFRVGTP
jgi:hypothetical protein